MALHILKWLLYGSLLTWNCSAEPILTQKLKQAGDQEFVLQMQNNGKDTNKADDSSILLNSNGICSLTKQYCKLKNAWGCTVWAEPPEIAGTGCNWNGPCSEKFGRCYNHWEFVGAWGYDQFECKCDASRKKETFEENRLSDKGLAEDNNHFRIAPGNTCNGVINAKVVGQHKKESIVISGNCIVGKEIRLITNSGPVRIGNIVDLIFQLIGKIMLPELVLLIDGGHRSWNLSLVELNEVTLYQQNDKDYLEHEANSQLFGSEIIFGIFIGIAFSAVLFVARFVILSRQLENYGILVHDKIVF